MSIRLGVVSHRTHIRSLYTQLSNRAGPLLGDVLPSSRGRISFVSSSGSPQIQKPLKPKSDKPEKIKIKPEPPKASSYDLIGPPDVTSNIPVMKFHIPPNETDAEREYREKRTEVLQWTHDYWAHHNSDFFRLKEEYSAKKLKEKSAAGAEDEKPTLSAEEMSRFYKKFLDDNYKAHVQFNKEWYKKNVSLLWPAFKVFWTRQLKRRKT